jgi:hypothetical protein
VNNAGMTSQTPPDDLDGVDLAEWDRVPTSLVPMSLVWPGRLDLVR